MKLVHWPLMGWLLHFVQRGCDWSVPDVVLTTCLFWFHEVSLHVDVAPQIRPCPRREKLKIGTNQSSWPCSTGGEEYLQWGYVHAPLVCYCWCAPVRQFSEFMRPIGLCGKTTTGEWRRTGIFSFRTPRSVTSRQRRRPGEWSASLVELIYLRTDTDTGSDEATTTRMKMTSLHVETPSTPHTTPDSGVPRRSRHSAAAEIRRHSK